MNTASIPGLITLDNMFSIRKLLLLLLMFAVMVGAHAQTRMDPLPTNPRGMTEIPPVRSQQAAAAAAPAGPSASAPVMPLQAMQPFPPNPATSADPIVFGSQIFTGRFGSEAFSGFNPEYQIAVGDRINLRMWGAFTFEAVQPVDAQGNIFIPNVGPVFVLGIRNGELNRQVETQVKRIFRANVGVYATLESAQPVKIYVTGYVKAPGLYSGLSSDSVLYYLDKAGGIDPDRGSYLKVDVLRASKLRTTFNLYGFLLSGNIAPLQLQDGDTIVVGSRKHTVLVSGEVLNPYRFEFDTPTFSARELLRYAQPRPSATHMSVARKIGAQRRSEYYALDAVSDVVIQDGDEIIVTSDKYAGTILVRIDGAHQGERTIVLPYGARLRDVVERIKPAPQANMAAMQLFRRSVATRQRELWDMSLRGMETYALTARSATSEEAALRTREADLILQFIDRARNIQPRGQVILAQRAEAPNTLLEDGDILFVPEQSNLVLVSGEVLMPNAAVWDPRASVDTYVQRAGGFNQGQDKARILVIHQDGSVAESSQASVRAGDEIMVLPKIETKSIEITRGITQIIYQIAIAARVILNF